MIIKLKVGELLAINSQEELNELADILGIAIHDGIFVGDDQYVAYLDFDGAVEGQVHIEKLEVFRNTYPNFTKKPRKFKSWVRSLK